MLFEQIDCQRWMELVAHQELCEDEHVGDDSYHYRRLYLNDGVLGSDGHDSDH